MPGEGDTPVISQNGKEDLEDCIGKRKPLTCSSERVDYWGEAPEPEAFRLPIEGESALGMRHLGRAGSAPLQLLY